MHGLINRSIELFVTDNYGRPTWRSAAARAGLGIETFEPMLTYPPDVTERVLASVAGTLGRDREAVLEDLGTYLVTHPRMGNVRRLLRFGGETFIDFLHSLEELSDRARLAVPDLEMPEIELRDGGASGFVLEVRFDRPGFGWVLVGVLRAMADDYGALAVIDGAVPVAGGERLTIEVPDCAFVEGRSFHLAATAG